MPFLNCQLHHLVLFNYEIEPEVLAPYVPAHTELDYYDGRAYVSLVGFTFQNPKVYSVALPFYRNYAQVNLRFYVQRQLSGTSWRHGVVFIRQIVPHRLLAWTGHILFNESMVALGIDRRIRAEKEDREQVEYRWSSPEGQYFIKADCLNHSYLPVPGSAHDFFLKRHWGYSSLKDGGCFEYRFDHPPWRARDVVACEAAQLVGDYYGPPFRDIIGPQPESCLAAYGSKVALHRGNRLV